VPRYQRERLLIHALQTILILRAGRWTVAELAGELGVERRTAYRIVDSLRRAGVTVEISHESVHAYYRIRAAEMRRVLRL
jgi:predicted DNA-binding transcriptional regulator YafY